MNTFKKICGLVLITLSSALMAASDDTEVFTVGFMSWPLEQSNQIHVARQIESITDPTPAQQELLNDFAFLGLTQDMVETALTEMSGIPYVNDLQAMELSTNLLIRRLYAQIRSYATRPLCCQECSPAAWLEFSGGSSFFKRNQNAPGFNVEDYEATVGAQGCFDCWTVGGAFSYQYDSKHFHSGAHGKTNGYHGAIYGLYRSQEYYLMLDIMGGYYASRINRKVDIANIELTAKGRPKAFDTVVYAEIGKDFNWRSLLIQPFFGLEGGYYGSKRISESGLSAINLNVHEKSYGTANSRLGLHLSSWDGKYGFEFGFDLSWQYRLIAPQESRRVSFETFGESFSVHGVKIDRSSFDGAFSVAKRLDTWTIFVQVEGQVSNTLANYNVMGGLNYAW